MYKIDAYSVYQQSSYNSVRKSKVDETKTVGNDKALDKANKADKAESKVELSKAAKNLLSELKKKYGNMDFMIANYSSEEEAADILSRGAKEYSVLIEPEMLEKMAKDEEYKAEQLGILEEATGKLKEMGAQLGDKADDVKRLDLSIDADGKITYFAELEKMNEKQKERIEKSKADKKEAEETKNKKEELKDKDNVKESEKLEKDDNRYGDKHKKAFLKSDSVEGLLEAIAKLDWNEVKPEQAKPTGGKFDFSA